jgi:sulfur carrier protein ThiS
MRLSMKVKVKFVGIPEPPSGFEGQKEAPVGFSGNTVKDLIYRLVSSMDLKNRELFLSDQDEISTDLAVIVNGSMISDSNRCNFRLKEGDLVELVSAPG